MKSPTVMPTRQFQGEVSPFHLKAIPNKVERKEDNKFSHNWLTDYKAKNSLT